MDTWSPAAVQRAHVRLFHPAPAEAVGAWQRGEINLCQMMGQVQTERSAGEALAQFRVYEALAEGQLPVETLSSALSSINLLASLEVG